MDLGPTYDLWKKEYLLRDIVWYGICIPKIRILNSLKGTYSFVQISVNCDPNLRVCHIESLAQFFLTRAISGVQTTTFLFRFF